MNCTICGEPIHFSSAAERAAKDVCRHTAAYYTSLFTTHSACTLRKSAEETTALMKRACDESDRLDAAGFYIFRPRT